MRFMGELATVIIGTAVCTSLLSIPLMVGSYHIEKHITERVQSPETRRRCADCHRKYVQARKVVEVNVEVA